MATFLIDDYLTADDDSASAVAANNAGLATLSADLATAGGGVVEFTANAVYYVGGAGNQPRTATPINTYYTRGPARQYLLELNDLTGVILRGNNATLRNAGGGFYGTFDSDDTPRSPATMPYSGPTAATPYYAMIRVDACSDVTIEDLELDGNIGATAIGSGFSDTGIQLQMTGLLLDDSRDVTVRRLHSHHHGLDGTQLNGAANTEAEVPEGMAFHGSLFHNNGRNNVSVVGGRGLVLDSCRLWQAGKGANGVASAPGAGIDFEAEGGRLIRDVLVDNCYIADNLGVGIVSDSGTPVNRCTIRRSVVIGTTSYSLWLYRPGWLVEESTLLGTLVDLYPGHDIGTDPFRPDAATQFRRCLFTDDQSFSPTGSLYLVNNLLVEGAVAYVAFDRCSFVQTRNVVGGMGNFDGPICTDCTFVAQAGALNVYARFRGTQTHFVEDGGYVSVPNTPTVIIGRNDAGRAEDAWKYTTVSGSSHVTTTYAANVDSRTGTTVLSGSASYDPAAIAAGAQASTTVYTPGAAVGDFVAAAFAGDLQGIDLSAYVATADTTTVLFRNGTAASVDLSSATLRVYGFKAA